MGWYCGNFLFQAEDGIRVLTVTGVQTCALPISLLYCFIMFVEAIEQRRDFVRQRHAGSETGTESADKAAVRSDRALGHARSEERRVGKECRCWWSMYS